MSTDQQLPPPAESGAPGAPGAPGAESGVPGGPFFPPVAPVQRGTNGLAIAGFVLAIVVAPVGFILSIIGAVQAGRRNQKGKGLAVAGIVIGLIFSAGGIAGAVALGGKVSTLADPGCTTAKSAVLDNSDKVDASDAATVKDGLTATVTGLTSAQGKATHDNVRNAVKALNADYSEYLNDVNSGTAPAADLQSRLTNDANAFDSLCSIDTGTN
jgi:hypothetical protein